MEAPQMDHFSAARYMGNKSRFIPFLNECFLEYGLITGDGRASARVKTIADICCGTGATTWWFANLPGVDRVWAADVSPCAVALTRARVCSVSPRSLDSGLRELETVADTRGASVEGYEWVMRASDATPTRPMFDTEVARKLARVMRHVMSMRDGALKTALIGSVLEGALRSCNGFGKFTSAPLATRVTPRAWSPLTPCAPMGATASVTVQRSDVLVRMAASRQRWDVMYIDPPYDRSSTYGAWYHFLNTLLLNDQPAGRGPFNVRQDATAMDAPFRLKDAAQTFERLFAECAKRCKYLVISYTTTGVVSISYMKRVLSACAFRNVREFRTSRRKYSTFAGVPTRAKEVLIIATSARMPE